MHDFCCRLLDEVPLLIVVLVLGLVLFGFLSMTYECVGFLRGSLG